jgi:type IV fimbrial biogenesis protein FimT
MRPTSRGFTLPEVLTVVAILGLLAAVAAPNLGAMIRTQRVKTAAFDVMSSLLYARSEAVKRNASVTITPSAGNWANGWTLSDANANTLRSKAAFANVSITGPASIVYSANGRLAPVGASPQFSLSASDVATANQRCIKVSPSGAPFSAEGTCS